MSTTEKTSNLDVKHFIDSEEVRNDIRISSVDLDEMMMRHPSLAYHYANKTISAKAQSDYFQDRMELLEAALYGEYKTTLSVGGSRATETAIKNAIILDTRYQTMQKKVREAQSELAACKAAENAFDHRRELILEIARDRRKEREGAMRVMGSSSDDQLDFMKAKYLEGKNVQKTNGTI